MQALVFEEHSSVLPEWWRRRVHERTLVYLDAHLDLQHVNSVRLANLQRCTTLEAVARLEKPHHLCPDAQFSFGIEDFLYAAHRLHQIRRLVWVAPRHVRIGYSQVVFEQLQQMDGVRSKELTGFRRVGSGAIEGRLLGLNITICNYQQLEALSLPEDALFDIDTDFFVTVPGDEAWIDPRHVVSILKRLAIKTDWITISRSVSSGFMPLRYHFFADYLAALWEDRGEDSDHFERLFSLDRQLQSGDCEAVATACQRELESYPQCAATHYLRSLSERDPDCADACQRQAAELCPIFYPCVLRAACEIPNRRLPLYPSAAAQLEMQLTESPLSQQQRALAEVALGLVHCHCGGVQRAMQLYELGTQDMGSHHELALEIGKILLQSSSAGRAIPFLEAALQDDKTRTSAHVHLGQFYERQGSAKLAIEHLETAVDMAPAWIRIRYLLATLLQGDGRRQRSQVLFEQCKTEMENASALARRL